LPSISASRQTEPAKLTRLVRGELDWIVMKALEKDRNRRYETASGFAMDIQRYLADEPVLACPPSASYKEWKRAREGRLVRALRSPTSPAKLRRWLSTVENSARIPASRAGIHRRPELDGCHPVGQLAL
jgi:hypothetical protein